MHMCEQVCERENRKASVFLCVRERERGPSQMQARHSLERGIKGEGSEKQEGGTTTTTTTSMNESISGAASCRNNETNGLA